MTTTGVGHPPIDTRSLKTGSHAPGLCHIIAGT